MTHDVPRGRSGRPGRDIVADVARQAGKALRERFGSPQRVVQKGRGNVVTEADHQVEQRVVALLGQEYPGFGVLAEESGAAPTDSRFTWVIDPLDGTRNFASGIPHFSVVIALARGDHVVLGATYDPMRDELFLAQEGEGATLNGRPIHVSQKRDLQQCLIGYDMSYDDDQARYSLELVLSLWPGIQTVRVMGSSALGLAYAAAGRLDLYFHPTLNPWDLASGLILAQESGAAAVDKGGRPARLFEKSIIVANADLVAQFRQRTGDTAWARG